MLKLAAAGYGIIRDIKNIFVYGRCFKMGFSTIAALPEIVNGLEKLNSLLEVLGPVIEGLDESLKGQYKEKYHSGGLKVKMEIENTQIIIMLKPIQQVIDIKPEI